MQVGERVWGECSSCRGRQFAGVAKRSAGRRWADRPRQLENGALGGAHALATASTCGFGRSSQAGGLVVLLGRGEGRRRWVDEEGMMDTGLFALSLEAD